MKKRSWRKKFHKKKVISNNKTSKSFIIGNFYNNLQSLRFDLFRFSSLSLLPIQRLPYGFFLDVFLFWVLYYLKNLNNFFPLFIYKAWLNSFIIYYSFKLNTKFIYNFYKFFKNEQNLLSCYITYFVKAKLNFICNIFFNMAFNLMKFFWVSLNWVARFNYIKHNYFSLFKANWLTRLVKKNKYIRNFKLIRLYKLYKGLKLKSIAKFRFLRKRTVLRRSSKPNNILKKFRKHWLKCFSSFSVKSKHLFGRTFYSSFNVDY